MYGYDLGGAQSEEGWKVAEVDEDGNWLAPWIGPTETDPIDGLLEALYRALLPHLARPTDDAPVGEWRAYSNAKIAAEATLGITLEMTGHHDFTGYVLAAHCTDTGWSPVSLDLAELDRRRVAEDWDGKLAAAVRALGFTPMDLGAYESQEQGPRHALLAPGWLLAPVYM